MNALDNEGQTPLMYAARGTFLIEPDAVSPTQISEIATIAKTLIEHGANALIQDDFGQTALDTIYEAPFPNRFYAIAEILQTAMIDQFDENLPIPERPLSKQLQRDLFIAVRNDDLNAVNSLLDAGADPNARDRLGSPILSFAVIENKTSAIAEALLRAGADPSAEDQLGQTALDFATAPSQAKIASLLQNALDSQPPAEGDKVEFRYNQKGIRPISGELVEKSATSAKIKNGSQTIKVDLSKGTLTRDTREIEQPKPTKSNDSDRTRDSKKDLGR